jgi:ribose transport system ATP-binding protein
VIRLVRQPHQTAAPGSRGSGPRTAAPALSLDGLTKQFGQTVVLNDVSLTVEPGEVHALVGSNGSGKSTLVKVITGVYSPTTLRALRIAGEDARVPITRKELERLGVRVVHQSLGLVDSLSVVDNVALAEGYCTFEGASISWRKTRALVAETLDRLGVDAPLDAPISALPAWQQVAVAAARVFHGDVGSTRLVLLDEVTAAMPRDEVSKLFDLIARLTAGNVGVLYVTHRFEEIFALAHRATVIRDGRVVGTHPVSELSKEMLVSALTGAVHVEDSPAETAVEAARLRQPLQDTVALEAVGCAGALLRDFHLTVGRGEIVGVTGRAGSGKSELGRLLYGLQRLSAGQVRYGGYEGPLQPARLIAAGVAYVPPDRKRQGILSGATLQENLTLPSLRQFGTFRLSRRRERWFAEGAIEKYGITPDAPEIKIDALSGGNQQKSILSRWMLRRPSVVILDEPTEGVDVPARNAIYHSIREASAAGTAVLVLSSSVEEIVELCDRAVVLDEGRLSVELDRSELDVTRLSHAVSEGGVTYRA